MFWSAVLISPVRDESGDVVQHFASFVDLTDHKQEQAQSRMLIDELNHRVKNTLATVQSIVWQALRNTSDPEVIRESIEFAPLRPLPIARPVDPRELGRCGTARSDQGGLGAVRGCKWTVGALCHHGQEYPRLTESRPCARHRVPRTRDQCREIRRVFQQGRISPDFMDDRAVAGGQSASPALAGEGRPARDTTIPERVRLAGNRARSGSRAGGRGRSRLPDGRRRLHDQLSCTERCS